jgi:hypothetical protein
VFPKPPPRVVYDRLVDSWEEYLRRLHELTASLFQPDWKFEQWVPWLLWRHVMQRARVIHLDLKVGYSEEALDHARPMISATMILCLIVRSPNPGGWALRYWIELGQRDHDFIDLQEQLGRFSADYAKRKRKESDDAVAEAIKGARERDGITMPDKLAPPAGPGAKKKPEPDKRSWHGLTDKGLAAWLPSAAPTTAGWKRPGSSRNSTRGGPAKYCSRSARNRFTWSPDSCSSNAARSS